MNDVELKHLRQGQFITPNVDYTDSPMEGEPVTFRKGRKYLVVLKLPSGAKILWNEKDTKFHWLLVNAKLKEHFAIVAK